MDHDLIKDGRGGQFQPCNRPVSGCAYVLACSRLRIFDGLPLFSLFVSDDILKPLRVSECLYP